MVGNVLQHKDPGFNPRVAKANKTHKRQNQLPMV